MNPQALRLLFTALSIALVAVACTGPGTVDDGDDDDCPDISEAPTPTECPEDTPPPPCPDCPDCPDCPVCPPEGVYADIAGSWTGDMTSPNGYVVWVTIHEDAAVGEVAGFVTYHGPTLNCANPILRDSVSGNTYSFTETPLPHSTGCGSGTYTAHYEYNPLNDTMALTFTGFSDNGVLSRIQPN